MEFLKYFWVEVVRARCFGWVEIFQQIVHTLVGDGDVGHGGVGTGAEVWHVAGVFISED